MSGSSPSIPKEFIRITDPAEEEILFREALRTHAHAILWTSGQTHVLKTHFNSRRTSKEAFSAEPPPGIEPRLLTREMARAGIHEFFFSVSLSRANILFKAPYLGYNPDGMHFRNPEKLYKVQRRKDMRLTIRDGYLLKVQFTGRETMIQKVYDLSAGGISFLIEQREAPDFEAGTQLRNIIFTVNQKTVCADGIVRYVKPFQNNRFKIGVLFTSIAPSDAQHIGNYVIDENMRLMSRFL